MCKFPTGKHSSKFYLAKKHMEMAVIIDFLVMITVNDNTYILNYAYMIRR